MPLIVKFFRKELLALFIVVLSISSSFGDFVFTIDNVQTLPGRTVLVVSMRRATTTTPSLGSTCRWTLGRTANELSQAASAFRHSH